MLVHPGIHISTFLLCAWISCEAHAQGDTAESITEITHSAPATSEKSFVAYPAQFPQASSLYISRHPAKIIPKRVLPITPDMGGEVEVIHRTEGKVKKGTLLVRINPDELALDEQELQQQIERNNLLDSWKTYDDWLLSTQAYIRFRQTQGGLTPDELSRLYEEDLALQQEMLDQESKNVERECALIQEYGLPADNSTPASVFDYPNRMNHTIVEQVPRGYGGPDSTFKKTSNPQLNSSLTS